MPSIAELAWDNPRPAQGISIPPAYRSHCLHAAIAYRCRGVVDWTLGNPRGAPNPAPQADDTKQADDGNASFYEEMLATFL